MLKRAETLVEDDFDLQKKARKGLRMKDRRVPPEVIGRMYAQYCELINSMYDAYLNNVQLQRLPYIQEIITVFMKRMYELRNELVHLIVNDYIYVDSALQQLMKTPFDIQIVVPYHFPMEARPDSVEQILQKMWAQSVRRLRKPSKPKENVPTTSSSQMASSAGSGLFESPDRTETREDQGAVEEEVEEEEEETPEPSVHTMVTEDYIQACMIQKYERYRQYYLRAFASKCATYRTYFAPKTTPPSKERMERAVQFIQRYYRFYMEIKRRRVLEHKRNVLLGLVPDVEIRPMKFKEENNKLYEKRRQMRINLNKKLQLQVEKENLKLIYKKGEQIEDITVQIMEWFMEWYYGYGFFPQYPFEPEGGTLMVIRGQYQTIDERIEEDEKIKAATKGKTKEQLKQEKQQAKMEAAMKAEIAEEKKKKEALALFKARCNPDGDPGYELVQSELHTELTDALRRYRQAWSLYDQFPLERCAEVIYGFMKTIVTEDIMSQIHIDARKFVDELMRLELKLFIKAQQAMYKRVDWKWPKQRPRKRPKPVPVPKPFVVNDDMLKSFEKVFDLGIMSRPTAKLDDIIGDFKFAAYEANLRDPKAIFPSPGYGDVKRRLVLSCIFGAGVDPGAVRRKSVMLLGLEQNGKSFLADAVAGELNAVKFDISPEVFTVKCHRPTKMLSLIFQAARVFQPSVIFCRNVEKVFYKKVPHNEKKERAKTLKKPLQKLLKAMPVTEKIIFIATCSNPFAAKARPMVNMFSEMILVPRPDYGSIQRFLYDKLQSIRSMPRDYCVQSLAQILQGLGFGVIMDLFDDVVTPERLIRTTIN
ncbi:IQ and AAA domain-containing protein 1-like isoform X2 [Pectinophora gossypiella]|uniref:IQ and AAA domain-containing protein 1-like isoform X2 n=1 Tax=Pectinophora gossypiella TaxID=13191 RepID=UPI00214DFF3A|nr:IQ and AAA domain-containing protein 1-like isoform X2 [Pectinophora gossypiella]